MNEAAANISWLPFNPRDWEQLTPAFGRLRSVVGAHGPKLIANRDAATFFNQCVHDGRLKLALVRPDFMYRLFDEVERRKLTIRVPLDYEEGCGIEPDHEGRWYVQRSDLEKLEAGTVTPGARAEAELAAAGSEADEAEPESELAKVERTRWQRDRTIAAIKALHPPHGIRPKGVSIAALTIRINRLPEFQEDKVSEDTVRLADIEINDALKK